MEAFPNAKVVLSVRDPVTWYNSVKNTILMKVKMENQFPYSLYNWMAGRKDLSKIGWNTCPAIQLYNEYGNWFLIFTRIKTVFFTELYHATGSRTLKTTLAFGNVSMIVL